MFMFSLGQKDNIQVLIINFYYNAAANACTLGYLLLGEVGVEIEVVGGVPWI